MEFGRNFKYLIGKQEEMNWLDILIVVVLAVGTMAGVRRGLVRQFVGLVGLIVSLVVAYSYMEVPAPWLEGQIGISTDYSGVVGFAAVFLIVQLCIMLLGRFLDRIVSNIVVISGLNQILGGAFGLVTTALFFSIALYFLSMIGLPPSDLRNSSSLYELVYTFLPQAWEYAAQQFPVLAELPNRLPAWFQ